jgi:hypothetical protein
MVAKACVETAAESDEIGSDANSFAVSEIELESILGLGNTIVDALSGYGSETIVSSDDLHTEVFMRLISLAGEGSAISFGYLSLRAG